MKNKMAAYPYTPNLVSLQRSHNHSPGQRHSSGARKRDGGGDQHQYKVPHQWKAIGRDTNQRRPLYYISQ